MSYFAYPLWGAFLQKHRVSQRDFSGLLVLHCKISLYQCFITLHAQYKHWVGHPTFHIRIFYVCTHLEIHAERQALALSGHWYSQGRGNLLNCLVQLGITMNLC